MRSVAITTTRACRLSRILPLLLCGCILPAAGADLSDLRQWAGGDSDASAPASGSDCEAAWDGYDQASHAPLSGCDQADADSGSTIDALRRALGVEGGTEASGDLDATPASDDGYPSAAVAAAPGRPLRPKARIGDEDRVPTDVSTYPYRSVGRIELGKRGSDRVTGTCTGALVGPRIVVTNGHCVWDQQAGEWYRVHVFVPGLKRTKAPDGRYAVKQLWVSRGYQEGERGVDFAFLILEKPAGKRVGWLGTRTFDARWLDHPYWIVAGYPTNFTGNAFRADLQVAHIGCNIRQVGTWTKEGPLFHDCDTGQGASGSPLFGYWDGKPYVIGVNYAGWGPRNRERMESCSPPEVGKCMNMAASARAWQPLLRDLLRRYPD